MNSQLLFEFEKKLKQILIIYFCENMFTVI